MNMDRSKRLTLIAIIAAVLLVGGLVFVYYWLLDPLKSEVAMKEKELETEEQIVSELQSNTLTKETAFETTVELQKRLPVKALVPQLMLDIEKAEIISRSFVKAIEITEDEGETAVPAEEPAEEAAAETEEAAEESEEAGEENDSIVDEQMDEQLEQSQEAEQEPELLPAGLRKIVITMAVQSPSYQEMEEFLASLESMRRILTVENITFEGNPEIWSIEQTVDILEYSVAVSAYYAPVLADLQEDLPSLPSTIRPAGKKNPMYQSPGTFSDDEEE